MLNEQHRDEAMEEKALKECMGGRESHIALTLTCFPVCGVFPLLLFLVAHFCRWIPDTRPKLKPGTFLWLLPNKRVSKLGGKITVSPVNAGIRG